MLGLEPSVESVQLEKADLGNFITRKQRKIRATAPQLRLRHTTRLVSLRCEGCEPKRSYPLLLYQLNSFWSVTRTLLVQLYVLFLCYQLNSFSSLRLDSLVPPRRESALPAALTSPPRLGFPGGVQRARIAHPIDSLGAPLRHVFECEPQVWGFS